MIPSPTTLRRVVTRCRTRDALAVRLGLEQSLGSLTWTPPGLAETAILCVRSLGDPLPRAWRFGKPTDEWRAALRNALGQEVQRAARPARETTGANANAVWFADQAELLTCLATDWLRGQTAGHWWWQSLFPGRSLAEAVTHAWLGAPEHAPAALDRLHDTHFSKDFLNALPTPTVVAISSGVGRAFGLVDLQEAITQAVSADRVDHSIDKSRSGSTDRDVNQGTDTVSDDQPVRQPPWKNWIQVQSALSAQAQSLLVLSIMLTEVPTVVRSLSFLTQVLAFAERQELPLAHQGESVRPTDPATNASPAADGRALSPPGQPVERELGPAPLRVDDISPGKAGATRPNRRGVASGRFGPPPSHPGESSNKTTGGSPSTQPEVVPGKPRPTPTDSRDAEQHDHCSQSEGTDEGQVARSTANDRPALLPCPRDPLIERVCSTEWGGVFYLINVALALELYGDFTRPRHPSLPLTVWDFLALMGRRLIGPAFEQDPSWDALTLLSGRAAGESPGAWFEPPDVWRTPDSWLTPFPERTDWRGGIANGRVRLEHPAGFTVLDAPCDPINPGAGFREECVRLGLAPDSETPLNHSDRIEASPALDRWVNRMARYVQCRFCRSLTNSDPNAILKLAFRHDAQLRVNSERVTVCFSLATHPIALRMAGLDRDPGWVPAAGRTIAFQYD